MDARSTSMWRPGSRRFCLEPRFVPRPGAMDEDDGWLLSVMFNTDAGGFG